MGLTQNKVQYVCVHGNEQMCHSATVWLIDAFLIHLLNVTYSIKYYVVPGCDCSGNIS